MSRTAEVVARLVHDALDRVDRLVWEAEKRQKVRDQSTIPAGKEAKYERIQAARDWQRQDGDR
jgi:hypothetical protein